MGGEIYIHSFTMLTKYEFWNVLVLHNAVRKRQEVPARVLLAVVSTFCEISKSTKLILHLKIKFKLNSLKSA